MEAFCCWFPAGGDGVAGVIWLVKFLAGDNVDECAEAVGENNDANEKVYGGGFVHVR